jgi:hypothetical protein
MAMAKQFSVMLENRRGALAELCSELAKVAINIRALMVPEEGRIAPVRLVVNDVKTAERVLEKLGVKYDLEDIIAARLTDRPGALGKLMRKLADHGIDVRYAYGSILQGTEKAMIIVAVSNLEAAAKIAK